MEHALILKNIAKHINLEEEERHYLLSHIKLHHVKRKDLLQRQGDLCRYFFFVESGSLRAFNINEEGRESTIMFARQDWWITDIKSFINKASAQLSIESLEESKVISISWDTFMGLFDKYPKFEKLFRILFQNAYIREQERTLQYLSSSTLDRYNNFVSRYPGFVEKATQKQIASYLGVTPEFLSSIKKNTQS